MLTFETVAYRDSEKRELVEHIPVLLEEVLQALGVDQGGFFLDLTFGGGGHSRAILEAHPENRVFALDCDLRAVQRGQALKDDYQDRFEIFHGNFADAVKIFKNLRFNGALADLGLSTFQLYENRGFSFKDEELDMRMDETSGISDARSLVNDAEPAELRKIFYEGGVRDNVEALVEGILKARPIKSARQLASIANATLHGGANRSRHKATVVFQALRIAVNGEFSSLRSLLDALPLISGVGTKVAIITFHSLEDQIVASKFRAWAVGEKLAPPSAWRGTVARPVRALGKLTPKKFIAPSDDELASNPASRSARLRVFTFS
ncbi:MAG TPA: 16S rRNA (cytosine(1402)-N(4))-methyltransferase RsmH [Oligoflexia bacterium]|nr:16S rRNA (cytosine(1402)-N(4))-methyltransferase RsmH [Oligoflexia bacterium]HMP27760.1 16S rRNA (cytosine(1402)-N(4))-methyltransferase RsmH [Oligoflexia bacterium]